MQKRESPARGAAEPGEGNAATQRYYRRDVDFATVAATALRNIDAVLSRWLPDGKRQGAEYLALNPTRVDNKPGSFSINLGTGCWSDFAVGDRGGDLIALVSYVDRCSQREAARRLAEFLGIEGRVNGERRAKPEDWQPIAPVPKGAPEPPGRHPKLGEPSLTWSYRGADGQILFCICRFETPQGKETRPLSFCRAPGGRTSWRWKALPAPRPLYGLDRLAARPEAPVIVCEGEKAADAAGQLLPVYVAVTPPNGANAPGKADWSPLAGRAVGIWPDHDEPGTAFAREVAKLALAAGAAKVVVLDVEAAFGPNLLKGWDAADALADGWTPERIAPVLERSEVWRAPEAEAGKSKAARNSINERFRVSERGVFYVDDDGEQTWICSRLEVTALTRDAHGEGWGRLLEFPDLEGKRHVWAMPMAMLKGSGEELRGELLRLGRTISTSPRARARLSDYIQQSRPEALARCVEQTGWHGNAFVFPTRTLGEGTERVLFQADTTHGFTYRKRGALGEWRDHVATLCAGNTRLVFCVSAGFAALLLEPVGDESGGFNLRSDSSSGKTTALRVAASVFGGPDYVQRWRATDNGLEAVAAQHTDTLLILDELAQVDPRVAGEVAYLLANGQGKSRANRSGGARPCLSWRLLFLSAGEIGLAEHMRQAGKKARAGQEIRLADIPADAGAGLGVFEVLYFTI